MEFENPEQTIVMGTVPQEQPATSSAVETNESTNTNEPKPEEPKLTKQQQWELDHKPRKDWNTKAKPEPEAEVGLDDRGLKAPVGEEGKATDLADPNKNKPKETEVQVQEQLTKNQKYERFNKRIIQLNNEKKALEQKLAAYEAKEQAGQELSHKELVDARFTQAELESKRREEAVDIKAYADNASVDKEEFMNNFDYYVPLMNKNHRETLKIIRSHPEPWFALECFMSAEAKGLIDLESFSKMSIPKQRNIIFDSTARSRAILDNAKKQGQPAQVQAQKPALKVKPEIHAGAQVTTNANQRKDSSPSSYAAAYREFSEERKARRGY